MDTRYHQVEVDVINEMGIVRDPVSYCIKHKSKLNSFTYVSSTSSPSASTFASEGGPTSQMIMNELLSLRKFITQQFDGISKMMNHLEAFQEDDDYGFNRPF